VRNILVVLLAVAWLPMTAHCRLEIVPGLEFLACQSESESSDNESSDCAECCSVEKSQYRIGQHRLMVAPPNLPPLSFVPVADLANTFSGTVGREVLAVVPPELPRCWQFAFRTASPPRAPSFAS